MIKCLSSTSLRCIRLNKKKRAIAALWRLYHARSDTTDYLTPGGVCTLIALYHARETKSESFTSCRRRVSYSSVPTTVTARGDF